MSPIECEEQRVAFFRKLYNRRILQFILGLLIASVFFCIVGIPAEWTAIITTMGDFGLLKTNGGWWNLFEVLLTGTVLFNGLSLFLIARILMMETENSLNNYFASQDRLRYLKALKEDQDERGY